MRGEEEKLNREDKEEMQECFPSLDRFSYLLYISYLLWTSGKLMFLQESSLSGYWISTHCILQSLSAWVFSFFSFFKKIC